MGSIRRCGRGVMVMGIAAMAIGGCSSSDAADASAAPPDGTLEIAASAETTSELGVTRWRLHGDDAQHVAFRGLDSRATVVVELDVAIEDSGSAATRAVDIRSTVDGRISAMRFTVDDKGHGRVIENELHDQPRVQQAIDRFEADMRDGAPKAGGLVGGGGSLVTSSLHTSAVDCGALVSKPGEELLCTWEERDWGSFVGNCGSMVGSCAVFVPVAATGEPGVLDMFLCGNDVNGCANIDWKTMVHGPHYECGGVPCGWDCSSSAPAPYPGEPGTLNPNQTQEDCAYKFKGDPAACGCTKKTCSSAQPAKVSGGPCAGG